MRFYDVNKGSIEVDGVPVDQMTRHSLRAAYGMVLQDTWLKTGTIRDNIAMGRPDAADGRDYRSSKGFIYSQLYHASAGRV